MLQQSVNYLDKPYAQATLREHRECHLDLPGPSTPFVRDVLRFLGTDDTNVITHASMVSRYELPNLHRALQATYPDCKCHHEGGSTFGYPHWPQHGRFEMRPGRFRSFLDNGSAFFQLADDRRRILLIEQERGLGSRAEVSLFAHLDDASQLPQEWKKLRRWMRRHHYLKGQVIRSNGELIGKTKRVDWEEIALPDEVRQSLKRNIVDVLSRREVFRQNGIPQKRGILLYGPSGTGKTMIGKVLSQNLRATFIWVSVADITDGARSIRHVFDMARKLRPSILFFEDLDLFAGSRDSFGRSETLGELVSQMDGLEKNDGLIVVATTNDLDAIEPALKDRPSRFDAVLNIPLPEASARRQILTQHLDRFAGAQEIIDDGVAATEGFSGAQVREFTVLVVQAAIYRNGVDAQGHVQLEQEDLEEATATLTGEKQQRIGFRVNL